MLGAVGQGVIGMQRAAERFKRGAAEIARLVRAPAAAETVDADRVIGGMVEAKIAFALNAATARTAGAMTRRLLDILA